MRSAPGTKPHETTWNLIQFTSGTENKNPLLSLLPSSQHLLLRRRSKPFKVKKNPLPTALYLWPSCKIFYGNGPNVKVSFDFTEHSGDGNIIDSEPEPIEVGFRRLLCIYNITSCNIRALQRLLGSYYINNRDWLIITRETKMHLGNIWSLL